MSDLISRTDAIDVVRKWFDKIELNGDICIDGIISLPTAQPERKPYHEVWISALRTAPPERVCHGCKHEPRCSHEEPCRSCSNSYVNKWEGEEHV